MEGLGMGLDEAAVNAVRLWEYQPKEDAAELFQDAFEVDLPFRFGYARALVFRRPALQVFACRSSALPGTCPSLPPSIMLRPTRRLAGNPAPPWCD